MSSTPDNPPTDETKMSQVVPSLDTGSNQNGPQDPTDEESQSLGDGAAKKDDSTAKKDDPTAKMPTTDDAIKEQMVDELGDNRVQPVQRVYGLPVTVVSHNSTYNPPSGRTVVKTEATNKASSAWKASIESGTFDDSDAAEVDGPDGSGGPRAHDPRGQKLNVTRPDLVEAPAEVNGNNGKKKKSKKPNVATPMLKKGPTAMPKNRGTGFEEFYADPPVTPAEANEEQEIYSPDRPFVDRIEECLSRYRGRRRVQGELIRYFNEYLFLGGIESGQRAFQGIDPRDYAKASAEEKQQLGGVFGAIGENPRFYNPGRPENWSVDFSAVVAGYLSEGVPRLTWLKPKAEIEMQRAVEVVANFLRYLLQHDVCNEYKDDITNALVLCERAKEELPLIKNAIAKTPCRFNDATTRVFEGGKEIEYIQAHMRKEPMTADEGIFTLGMMLFGPRDVYEQLKTLKVVRTVGREEPCSLEVLSVHPVDDTARGVGKMYGKVIGVGEGIATGIIRCKHIFIRDDLCRGDAPEETPPDRVEVLMVDEGLLEFLRPGCIICVSLAELNIGLKYMVNLPEILPSFYRFLPQRMMRAYKPPRRNERPAPSALDPAGEEDQDAEE